MKNNILLESLRNSTANRQLKRTFKILLGVGLAGSLLLGALVVWGGIAAFRSLTNRGTYPVVQETILNLEAEIKNLPALAHAGCWETAKSFMNVAVWLEQPLAENYNQIKSACFEPVKRER